METNKFASSTGTVCKRTVVSGTAVWMDVDLVRHFSVFKVLQQEPRITRYAVSVSAMTNFLVTAKAIKLKFMPKG